MRPALLGLSFLLSACSLATLSSLDVPACERGEGQCEALNERDGIDPDACRLYQCSVDGECRFGPRDQDGDGLSPPRCADALPECGGSISCTDCLTFRPARSRLS